MSDEWTGARGEHGPYIHAGKPFGHVPVPCGIEVLTIDAAAGPLTAMRAVPAPGVGLRGTALFIPGFTGSKEDFYALFPLLAAHGWDVWAYSQRGQADSFAPKGVGSYGREQTAQDAVEVAGIVSNAARVAKVHLLGHSFGGTVAQAAVLERPELFETLSLMSSGPHGWPGRHEDIRERLLESHGADLWRLDNPRRADVPDDQLGAEESFMRLRSERTSSDELLGAIEQLADPHDPTFALKSTKIPMLVFHGVDDLTAWPQNWQRRMATMLGARYEVIENAGHCPNIDNPIRTAELLDDFWSRH